MRMLSEIEIPLHFGSVLSYSILLAPMGAITLYFLHFFFFCPNINDDKSCLNENA